MKKLSVMFCLVGLAAVSYAQTERTEIKEHGFKKENLFTGGSLDVGLGNGSTSFGIQPYFGYSVNRFLDVAVAFNYDYVSQRDYQYDQYGTEYYFGKQRYNAIGPAAFVRVFPVRFLYLQGQFEQNSVTQKYLPADGSPEYKETHNVSSFLVGAGLATGRGRDNKSYGYISILFDVAKNPYSPYLDSYGNVNPIIRAGYNIALFQGKQDRGRGRRRFHRREY